ncbi:GTP-binding protein [Theileria orientalis strain Shintoku]|uniref:GTP-binding protein n=1 Tax=Theileria orientalis strain Shintoku TaxID=869250 RepID=J4CDE2_THEOR|nr:GTP-binding protein [Theileria orientalis strain Shintoku]BAM40987.1 GTP-binding protein [Theileria orientalis strain Shintoku]|eukprot:XP_009691288.1 GTP-binding protein [Theileria orientalis strain Shintoku]
MAPKDKNAQPEPKVLLGRPKNNLKLGLVGLPNVGKSTTFNLLSKQCVPAENFPFCTISKSKILMKQSFQVQFKLILFKRLPLVPDERFDHLCKVFAPKKEISATLTIFDIAGLVRGAHKGEGLGNAFLSHIDAVDGILHVVRAFEDDEIIHTDGEVNPVNDLDTINQELILKDLDKVTKAIAEVDKVYQRNMKIKSKKEELDTLVKVKEQLETNKWISQGSWKSNEIPYINEYNFLTAKPIVYLVNLSENDFVRQKNKWLAKIAKWVQENNPGPIIPYSAQFEQSLEAFPTEEARQSYLKDKNAASSKIAKIITSGYHELQLIHYFTCGPDEVRCWTIRNGTKAPQAAGRTKRDNTAYSGAMNNTCRKEYVVNDGDIIFFKFNVTNSKK